MRPINLATIIRSLSYPSVMLAITAAAVLAPCQSAPCTAFSLGGRIPVAVAGPGILGMHVLGLRGVVLLVVGGVFSAAAWVAFGYWVDLQAGGATRSFWVRYLAFSGIWTIAVIGGLAGGIWQSTT